MARIVAQKYIVYIFFASEAFTRIHREELNSQYSAHMAVNNSAKIWKGPIFIIKLAQSSYFSEIRWFLPSMELGLNFA